MQDRMFDATDILRDWKPLFRLRAIEWLIRRLAGEADEVPARIDEGVERVGFACRQAAAAGTVDIFPRRVAIERVARPVELDIVGKHDRQLIVRNRNRSALRAVEDRDRRAPIALARHAPVAQAVLNRALAPAGRLSAADDIGGGLLSR